MNGKGVEKTFINPRAFPITPTPKGVLTTYSKLRKREGYYEGKQLISWIQKTHHFDIVGDSRRAIRWKNEGEHVTNTQVYKGLNVKRQNANS